MAIRHMCFKDGKEKAVTFSYDDAVQSDARFIKILDKNGLKGTFNVNAGMFAPEGTVYPEGQAACRMTRNEAYELYKNSEHEVALHGYDHHFLTHLPTSHMIDEILSERKILEEMFETRIVGGAYAFGDYDDTAVDVLRLCGVKYFRTTESTGNFAIPKDWLRLKPTCHHNAPNLMELADTFLNISTRYGPKLFYVWGHTYEFNQHNNWEVFEEFAEKIGGKEDIWYATNIEIYDYIKAYDSLEFYADGKTVYNPTLVDVWMVIEGAKYKIPSGETVKI